MTLADTWMGLSISGEQRQIPHKDLMRWAYRHEQQFAVGWSHHYTDADGTRLVRGDHVAEARKQGWHDLADLLQAHFNAEAA